MTFIKKSALCTVFVFFSNTVFANDITEHSYLLKNKPQSIMTLASADFSFDSLDETDGRVLIRGTGGRGGIRARRISLRR